MKYSRGTTVSWGGWCVSVETSSEDGYRSAKLSVIRFPRGTGAGKPMQRGDWDRRVFVNEKDAWQFALEHGYSQVYRKGWCPTHRRQHWWLGARDTGYQYGSPCTYKDGEEYAQNPYQPKWWVEKFGNLGISYQHWNRLQAVAMLAKSQAKLDAILAKRISF